jgi:hypothetical protein
VSNEHLFSVISEEFIHPDGRTFTIMVDLQPGQKEGKATFGLNWIVLNDSVVDKHVDAERRAVAELEAANKLYNDELVAIEAMYDVYSVS